MPKLKRFALALLTAALVAGCALLPFGVAAWQDHRRIGRIESETVEPIALQTEDSSLIDRLRLCSANQLYCEVQNMPIGTGVRYQEDTVIEQARQQLDLLHTAGILSVGADGYIELGVLGIDFLADPGEPSNNAMVWRVIFYAETGVTEVLIDDESGRIIALSASNLKRPPSTGDMDACGAAWAAYLGLSRVGQEKVAAEHAVERASKIEAVKYGISEEDVDGLWWTYGGVTLTNADDPEGYQVTYLFRAAADSFSITIA